jgi:hypothetical protein
MAFLRRSMSFTPAASFSRTWNDPPRELKIMGDVELGLDSSPSGQRFDR